MLCHILCSGPFPNSIMCRIASFLHHLDINCFDLLKDTSDLCIRADSAMV